MNILVAPNSMKGSLNAFDFADIIEQAFQKSSGTFNIRKVPVADGGDFTAEVLAKAMNAEKVNIEVTGPLGKMVNSKYFITENTAIIEMADASGMKLVNRQDLNPLKASSFGTGELISDALKNGCSEIFLTIGGSATVDGGMGMLEALDFGFFDENGKILAGNGENLLYIKTISVPESLPAVTVKIICDVDNPLLGVKGAANVFGPQKGATPEMVINLEKGLQNWALILQKMSGKNIAEKDGTGAAGGIALPLISFFDAEIVQGADFVLSVLNFDEHVKWADLVITGEGKIDAQTLNNKAPYAVSRWAKKYNKPVFAFGGLVEKEAETAFDRIFCITPKDTDLDYAIKNVRQILYNFAVKFAGNINELLPKH